MRIGIDTNILTMDKAGPAVYTQELISCLKDIDRENTYIYFCYDSEFHRRNLLVRKVKNIILDTFWTQKILPDKLKKNRIDLLHCPAFKAPLKCGVPLIVTFYDLHILNNPKDYNSWLALYCKSMLGKIAKSADKIITISEFSKKDIIKTLSVPEKKVIVTYCGTDATFRVISDNELKNRIRDKYNLNKKFILYVGAVQPRKNIPSLLMAYSEFKKKRTFDYDLVFVTSSGWRNKSIFALINKFGLKNNIKFLKDTPRDDLVIIYNIAEFFVYPSFFEGFGMPVLEAMSCGCPVICSNTSSLPEVIGSAGITIDPNNSEELTNAMKDVANNNRLRQDLKQNGLQRSRMFSWTKCANQTLEVYKNVCSGVN